MKQKHMTKEMRERIEKGIREGESLKEIAKAIDKDPTTISKEVHKHRNDVVPINPSIISQACFRCTNYKSCKSIKLCDLRGCSKECKTCMRIDVTTRCNNFVKKICKRIKKFPYVCNGCSKRNSCRLQKYEYIPLTAQRGYEKVLHESRQGLNLTGEEFKLIDDTLKEGFDKGQSINHIISNNKRQIAKE